MSYSVRSTHLEALHDGRMVEPGDSVSNSIAEQNPQLVERGVLVEDPKSREAKDAKKPEQKDGHKPAAAPQKEDTK